MPRVSVSFSPITVALVCLVLLAMFPESGLCQPDLPKGRTVYVPVYSLVYTGDRAVPVNLASTLSIRNTDPKNSIRVDSAEYYSSTGQLIKKMISKPLVLPPLASTSIFIQEKDTSGGFSTSFLVRWVADKEVSSPIIECVNIGAYSGLGISFVTIGKEIR
jgi:hypothetical protein